jgi:hypothetical protein
MNETPVDQDERATMRRIVAGAIYDFAGGLTSRDEPITFSSTHDCAPVAEACNAFLKDRGCLNGEPMTRDWPEALNKLPAEGIAGAFAVIKAAMLKDYDYAWAWHCNLAMAAQDEGLNHAAGNRAAARFMRMCFDIDTSNGPKGPGV